LAIEPVSPQLGTHDDTRKRAPRRLGTILLAGVASALHPSTVTAQQERVGEGGRDARVVARDGTASIVEARAPIRAVGQ
jgi:hypothetical protein